MQANSGRARLTLCTGIQGQVRAKEMKRELKRAKQRTGTGPLCGRKLRFVALTGGHVRIQPWLRKHAANGD